MRRCQSTIMHNATAAVKQMLSRKSPSKPHTETDSSLGADVALPGGAVLGMHCRGHFGKLLRSHFEGVIQEPCPFFYVVFGGDPASPSRPLVPEYK